MDTEISKLHLYLGLSKKELQRRVENGQVDLQILKNQINDYESQLKLGAISEIWIESHSAEQVDIFFAGTDSKRADKKTELR